MRESQMAIARDIVAVSVSVASIFSDSFIWRPTLVFITTSVDGRGDRNHASTRQSVVGAACTGASSDCRLAPFVLRGPTGALRQPVQPASLGCLRRDLHRSSIKSEPARWMNT